MNNGDYENSVLVSIKRQSVHVVLEWRGLIRASYVNSAINRLGTTTGMSVLCETRVGAMKNRDQLLEFYFRCFRCDLIFPAPQARNLNPRGYCPICGRAAPRVFIEPR